MLAFVAIALVSAGRFTTNSFCQPWRCVNPVFPSFRVLGEDVLAAQEQRQWKCVEDKNGVLFMDFCRPVVNYQYSVPVSSNASEALADVIRTEERNAVSAYFQQLNVLGFEAWDGTDPWQSSCFADIAKMACYTAFPKCNKVQNDAYLRPCSVACSSYIKSCEIECCDESVQCVFQRERTVNGAVEVESGYVPHASPSEHCTGDLGFSSARALRSLLVPLGLALFSEESAFAIIAVAAAFSLQGCELQMKGIQPQIKIEEHKVGFWRQKEDQSVAESFKLPDGSLGFNSCSYPQLAVWQVCSGRGSCEAFDPKSLSREYIAGHIPSSLATTFCKCNTNYAGPECRTERKSQLYAYLLSLFTGFLGLDQFYLGFYLRGTLKLFTLGGCGFWYMYDVVQTGTAAPLAYQYRAASDLPKFVAVLVTASFLSMVGFAIGITLVYKRVKAKRKQANEGLKWQADAEENPLLPTHAHMAALEAKSLLRGQHSHHSHSGNH